jgi:pyruvate,water dikinase
MSIGDLADLDGGALLDLLARTGEELVALHGHEVLAGMLLRGEEDRSGVAGMALAALRRGRAEGLSDGELVARTPVVLALLPPTVGEPAALPRTPADDHQSGAPAALGELGCREALRLRCRWLQELGARVVRVLAARLVASGLLDRPDLVSRLTLAELRTTVAEHRIPPDLAARELAPAGPPLPVAFRLTPSGTPVLVGPHAHRRAEGLAASAGRGLGVVCHDVDDVPAGVPCVLVVDVLDPRLAPALPLLAGLVSETGSALSHLAILAREMHVPTVVAVPDARTRFRAGTRVLVDGSTGEVRTMDGEAPPRPEEGSRR